ncbi:MAG: YggS family pyridoxal phosphate-dependent enzyme [Rikenellaceae bacterium]
MSIKLQIEKVLTTLGGRAGLVAVSKTYPAESIREAYDVGQRVFGESRPQEMVAKWEALPPDIEWRMIGHLQRNKVRMIAPFVSMIESVDSERLAVAIDAEASRCGRVIDCLLEIHVAQEWSKTGWAFAELEAFVRGGGFAALGGIRVRGVMGIASNTDDEARVRCDFEELARCKSALSAYFDDSFDTLSMGMTDDYEVAVECGSTSVRVGSGIFGSRVY